MRKWLSSLFIVVAMVFSVKSFAATQGTVGATSTGDVDISVQLNDLIRISDLQDYAFGAYGGSGDLSSDDDVCIYTNISGGAYNIVATGDGAANAFTITDGSNNIAYTVNWNDETGTTGSQALTSGTTVNAQTTTEQSDPTCGGGAGLTANLEVNIAESALLAAPSGNYSGTLTLVVTPE